MPHVMIDLETLGNAPGCVILSIGAVEFNPRTCALGAQHYEVVNTQSCLDAGLIVTQSTKDWWDKQSAQARKVLEEANASPTTISSGLCNLNNFLAQYGSEQVRVWGNGSDFDNAILAVAYEKVSLPVGWKFWNNRCYRTLKNLFPEIRSSSYGTAHNALDDAIKQAQHAAKLLSQFY